MRKLSLPPVEKEIIRCLEGLRMEVTSNKIAKTIHVHGSTVKYRLGRLERLHLVTVRKVGSRTYCKLNEEGFNNVIIR